MRKKAQASGGKIIQYMIFAVIGITVVVALAPTIFEDLAALEADVNLPGWLAPILVIGVSVGILLLVLRSMGVFK